MAGTIRRDLAVGIAASAAVVILTPYISRFTEWLWSLYLAYRRSASDQVYVEVARGFHEHTPSEVLVGMLMLLMGAFLVLLVQAFASIGYGFEDGRLARLSRT